jgi:hypothetical protein
MKQLLLCWTVAACTANSSTGISTASCPTGSTLTYASFGLEFIADNCLSCHTSKERPALTTQLQVRMNSAEILRQAL